MQRHDPSASGTGTLAAPRRRLAPGGLSHDRDLQIGEVLVMDRPREIVWTVLGSCVSVILHAPGRLSALCHAQLPGPGSGRCADECPHPCLRNCTSSVDFRYLSAALPHMLRQVRQRGIPPSALRVTLIGGASTLGPTPGTPPIGQRNAEMARSLLAREGLHLHREKVGGLKGYTIWYDTGTDLLRYRQHGDERIHLLQPQGSRPLPPRLPGGGQ